MLSVIQSYRFMNRGEKGEKQIKLLSPETPQNQSKTMVYFDWGGKQKNKTKTKDQHVTISNMY